MSYTITLVSYNFNNASVAFRDKISLDRTESLEFITRSMYGIPNLKEIAAISTCNRTEIYAVLSESSGFMNHVARQFRDIKGVDITQNAPDPSLLHNREAVEHLLGVAGGLKSMMLGENQILSQVKASYQLFLSTSFKFPILNRLFQHAIQAGKSIRTDTSLCEGAASISLAAVELTQKVFSNFSRRKALVVGAGETAQLVAVHFHQLGVNQFIIANRGKKRRYELARKFDGQPIALDELPRVLAETDIVVTATKSPSYLITREQMATSLRKRNYRSILIVDIGTPRNVDPAVADLREVFLYNIDNLKQVVAENLEKRKKEIPAAEAIVSQIADEFIQWYKTLEVVPTISKLANYFDRVRNQELKKYAHKTSDKEYKHLEQMSRHIVRKLLHHPIVELRNQSNQGDIDVTKIDALWKLFHLSEFEDEKT